MQCQLMSRVEINFNHALIYVNDVERSIRFYRDLLGFQLIEGEEDYARLRSPNADSTIGLHKLSGHVTSLPAQEGIRLYFEVQDLERFCDDLASKGVEFDQMPKEMAWGWKHAYLRDPDGHELSLYWAGDKRLQKPPK